MFSEQKGIHTPDIENGGEGDWRKFLSNQV
jgi:hypothetical protein